MDTGRYQLIITLGIIHVHTRQIILALSLAILPIAVQAANYQTSYQTYVIPTYGGEALLPNVR